MCPYPGSLAVRLSSCPVCGEARGRNQNTSQLCCRERTRRSAASLVGDCHIGLFGAQIADKPGAERHHSPDIALRFAERGNALVAIDDSRSGVVGGDSSLQTVAATFVSVDQNAEIFRAGENVFFL